MNEFKAFYEKMSEQLKVEHDKWVASNFKMRSIELARSQIKSAGDIDITPANEVLNKEYEAEKHRNEEMCDHMYHLKEFVRKMEVHARDLGEELNKSYDIFDY